MHHTRRHILTAAGAALLVPQEIRRAVADDYPNKPVRLIVASAPGGPSDVPARLASQILAAKFNQPFIVENRPGAGGALGARVAATAPPDGYTLLTGNSSTLAAIPAVSDSAGYDPVKDFAPVVRINEGFQILVVLPNEHRLRSKRRLHAADLRWSIQSSADMRQWTDAGASFVPSAAGWTPRTCSSSAITRRTRG